MAEGLSRRDFLKLLAGGVGTGMLYSCVGSKTLASLTETVTPKNIDTPPTRIETPPLASPTVEGWKIPTIKERKSLLAIPEFFTKLQGKNTNRIIIKSGAMNSTEINGITVNCKTASGININIGIKNRIYIKLFR